MHEKNGCRVNIIDARNLPEWQHLRDTILQAVKGTAAATQTDDPEEAEVAVRRYWPKTIYDAYLTHSRIETKCHDHPGMKPGGTHAKFRNA